MSNLLNTAACSHHLVLHQGVVSNISATETDIALEGTTMTLNCLPDLVLVGSNTSTCTENGEWEPDPSEVECIRPG